MLGGFLIQPPLSINSLPPQPSPHPSFSSPHSPHNPYTVPGIHAETRQIVLHRIPSIARLNVKQIVYLLPDYEI